MSKIHGISQQVWHRSYQSQEQNCFTLSLASTEISDLSRVYHLGTLYVTSHPGQLSLLPISTTYWPMTAAVLCSWGGNCRSSVPLAMHHRLCYYPSMGLPRELSVQPMLAFIKYSGRLFYNIIILKQVVKVIWQKAHSIVCSRKMFRINGFNTKQFKHCYCCACYF